MKKKILEFINQRINKPTQLIDVLRAARRRNEFKELTKDTLYYNIRNLIKEGLINSEQSREFHPKRKPIYLISKKTIV